MHTRNGTIIHIVKVRLPKKTRVEAARAAIPYSHLLLPRRESAHGAESMAMIKTGNAPKIL